MSNILRGDIFWVDLGIAKGSEQGGVRPAVIIQNDVGNKYSPTVIVCPITSEIKRKELPTHVLLEDYRRYGLKSLSQVIAEQIKTMDKSKIGDYIGYISDDIMNTVDKAIEISVNVGSAKFSYEPREVKVAKRKAREIEEIDQFLKMWFSKNSDMNRVMDYLRDREIMIKDLELYAKKYTLNYKDFYSGIENNTRMVG